MSYRDDTAAAQARAEAAEHAARVLAGEHARLTADLAAAREWLGGSRRRWAIGAAVTGVLAAAAGFAIARFTAVPYRDDRPVVREAAPEISGALVVLGPGFGRGAAKASVCIRESAAAARIGFLGTGDHDITLTPAGPKLRFGGNPYPLDTSHCVRLASSFSGGEELSGSVDLDCTYGDDRIVGRFELAHCR